MQEFEERWEVYPSRVGDEFAMYSVNLGVGDGAPYANLPWMNMVRVTFEPGPGGMPGPEANEALFGVEDFLHADAAARGGMQVGRLTYGGRRELFFYSATNDNDLLQSALEKRFPDLEVQAFAQEDPEWTVYFGFLYPTTVDSQRIRNQHTLRALHDNGDAVETPRPIEHTAFFPDAATRRTFKSELPDKGFSVGSEQEADLGDKRYGLLFSSHGPVDLGSIDKLTIPLVRRIDELGGRYDGWTCPLITSQG